ncbi:MAG: nucleotidyltransferase [Clostridia bacterium]|nr:nucleotidyltransferase [Clostridia bacterium]
MTKELTLVIMAGGLGSRFGGLKQVEPIDDNNNFIIDYSIFDAIRSGFDKVVFIIKKEHLDIFKTTIGERISKQIKVEYSFQGQDDFVPKNIFHNRTKPWGTGHAVLCAKNNIESNFVVINADDFYGLDGYRVASKFFKDKPDENTYAIVGYKAENTLTENGAVKRGVCKVKNGMLESVDESLLEKIDGRIFATSLATNEKIELSPNQLVSMNLICFRHNYLDVLEKTFSDFIHCKNTNLEKDEFFVLSQIPYAKEHFKADMKVLSTSAVWQGVTYKEDKEQVVLSIKKLRDEGVYPAKLWDSEK